MAARVLIYAGVVLSSVAAIAAVSKKAPPELTTPNYRIREITGIGHEKGVARQDPSNVIKVGDLYYAWYTRRKTGVHPYASTVYYATSKDGLAWTERGEAIGKGPKGAWDSFGVITPYVAVVEGKYYLLYTGTSAPGGFRSRDPNGTLRYIGYAVADKPDGPWRKPKDNRLISPDAGKWDSLIVDDAHVIVRGGKCWLYYKGGHGTIKPADTKWGLAVADKITGPYVKSKHNPLVGGHTVCLWRHRGGIAALIDSAGTERHTVQWSPDGIHFTRAAKISLVHTGCGPFDPDAFTDDGYGNGITWGVAQRSDRRSLHLVRFECDLTAPKPAAAPASDGDVVTLTPAAVANPKGDGPDGRGNTADDTWQFWFALAHKPSEYARLDLPTATMSAQQRKKGIPGKVTGPIAGYLPNPADTEGWIYHSDWDGRFEGVWGDKKANQVIMYPYVEKGSHCSVATTFLVSRDGNYDISGKLTDIQVVKHRLHKGFIWRVEVVAKVGDKRIGKAERVIGKGGPIGDEVGPNSQEFSFRKVALKKGQLLRLVIDPNKWWGTDMTRIGDFKIKRVK